MSRRWLVVEYYGHQVVPVGEPHRWRWTAERHRRREQAAAVAARLPQVVAEGLRYLVAERARSR